MSRPRPAEAPDAASKTLVYYAERTRLAPQPVARTLRTLAGEAGIRFLGRGITDVLCLKISSLVCPGSLVSLIRLMGEVQVSTLEKVFNPIHHIVHIH